MKVVKKIFAIKKTAIVYAKKAFMEILVIKNVLKIVLMENVRKKANVLVLKVFGDPHAKINATLVAEMKLVNKSADSVLARIPIMVNLVKIIMRTVNRSTKMEAAHNASLVLKENSAKIAALKIAKMADAKRIQKT